jgi:hypothetical protein
MRRSYAKKYIPIIAINKLTGECVRYETQFDASLKGFDTGKIGHCCRNHNESHRGFFWVYESDFTSDSYKECLYLNSRKPRPYLPSDSKVCTGCSEKKSLEFFSKMVGGKYGVDSRCKKCRSLASMARVRSDIKVRLSTRLRIRLYHALKAKQWTKNSSYSKWIGCDRDTLVSHLESQFTEHMNWSNYGKYWEIDHVIPFNSAKSNDELYKLAHYTNLKPLTVKQNRTKSGKENYAFT